MDDEREALYLIAGVDRHAKILTEWSFKLGNNTTWSFNVDLVIARQKQAFFHNWCITILKVEYTL